MLTAPARLGLTATQPEDPRPLARHVGRVVYAKRPEDLVGDGLSPYVLETIPVVLTREERQRYREHRGAVQLGVRAVPAGGTGHVVEASSCAPRGRRRRGARRSRPGVRTAA